MGPLFPGAASQQAACQGAAPAPLFMTYALTPHPDPTLTPPRLSLLLVSQGLYCAFTALCQPGVRRSPIVSRYLGRQAALARPSHTLTQVSPNDNQQAPSHARSQASGGPRAGVAPRPVALGSCAAAASSGTAAGGPRGAPFC